MSRTDNSYDDAFMESRIETIKGELEMTDFRSKSEARKEMSKHIRYYVHTRRHFSLT